MSDNVYPESKHTKAASCGFCGKALGKEYFFTCHVCGATYCYIHMYRHSRAHKAKSPRSRTIVAK